MVTSRGEANRGVTMFDTSDDGLRLIIENGESETVEFKRRPLPDGPTAALITSFANSKGGLLLIGVEDNAKVVGLAPEAARDTLHRLRGVGYTLLGDPIEAGIADIDGYPVVYAVIPKAPEHLAPVMTATGETFVRRGRATTAKRPTKVSATAGPTLTVFIAMSFREDEEPALVDYFAAMKRAADRTSLPIELVRIDLVEGDYEISAEILKRIDKCDAVIGDFTLTPANVYLEVGYARGRGKYIIQTARRGTTLEFDVRNWRTSFYSNATELEERLFTAFAEAYRSFTASASD